MEEKEDRLYDLYALDEDIKILEDNIKILTENNGFEESIFIKAIEHLIEAYRKVKEDYKRLDEIVKTYNVISNDYMPNDVKIVIADREYFNNGILKENLIPKSKIKEKIEEIKLLRKKEIDELGMSLRGSAVDVLQELLEEE